MNDQELEGILQEEPQVQPSSKFTALVMSAVRQEAATPPPLPFPWVCVAPLALGWIGVFVGVVVGVWNDVGTPATSVLPFPMGILKQLPDVMPVLHSLWGLAGWGIVGWIALALILTYVCVRFPLRLVSR